jgi:hypothetical protein
MSKLEIVDDFWNHEPGWEYIADLSQPAQGLYVYHKAEGDGVIRERKVYSPTENLLDLAKNYRDIHAGKRFDLDKGFVIGSLPMHLKFATGYAEAEKNDDYKWIRRFWNEDDLGRALKHWDKKL